MVAVALLAKARTLIGAIAGLASLAVASPALANSSAATADIAAPLRTAQVSKVAPLGSGDDEFRRLFSSWQALDRTGSTSIAATGALPLARRVGAVSIPSLMPVEGVRMTSDYGMRWHPILGGRREHKGVDLAGPIGTPVHATADGVVSRADWFSGYGLFIALEHGGDIETRYGHLSRLNVAAGQEVHKGDVIGYIGSTGRSTGPHLHYEVRIAGNAVNPIPYLQSPALREAEASRDPSKTGIGGE